MFLRVAHSIWTASAPAKLNLFLEVLHRRRDGFHELETLMVPVGVHDTLQLRVTAETDAAACVQLRVDVAHRSLGEVPLGEGNLVVRALQLLRHRAGIRQGAQVRLVKRIPTQAGLGGASSDAAAALLAGNAAWKLHWPTARLCELAAELGSDVPFFLHGRSAICRGRGERIEPVPHATRLPLVLVKPPASLATADVYQHFSQRDTRLETAPRDQQIIQLVDSLRRGCLASLGRSLFNRLQTAAAQLTPWIGRLAAAFDRGPAWGHAMSGSGTCYFGICRTATQSRRLASQLRACGLGDVWATSSCR